MVYEPVGSPLACRHFDQEGINKRVNVRVRVPRACPHQYMEFKVQFIHIMIDDSGVEMWTYRIGIALDA